MINAWEQLEIAISRDPVMVPLDATVRDAMVAMQRQSDLKGISAHTQTDNAADLDAIDCEDVDVASTPPAKSLEASSYVVIVDHDQVVGLLTKEDIGHLAMQQVPLESLTLRQVLRHPPVTIRESALTDLVTVLTLFQQHQLSYLPVLNNAHQLTGVISAENLHQLLHATLTASSEMVNAGNPNSGDLSTESTLRSIKKQFQHLAENIPGMIYRLVEHSDGDYELTYVSAQVEQMFEVAPKAMLQSINNFWERIHPDDLDWLHTKLQISAKTLKPFRHEHRLRLPHKGIHWVKMIAHPERAENGDVIWDGIVLDMGDLSQAKADSKQPSQKLGRNTRLKYEFLANMSYELRTLLNAILGMTEGLRDEVFGQINPQQLKTLLTIEQSGAHQLSLINEILDLAKVESGNLKLVYSTVSVADLCQSSLTEVKTQALEKGIQLHLNMPWNLPDIKVDERRIRQVLVHLLHNALNVTLTGGNVTLEVMPSLRDENQLQHYLRFVVTDNGPYEGKMPDLSLVKRIVELHGGKVAVMATNDDDSTGNCIAIKLPCSDAAHTPLPPQIGTGSGSIGSSSIGSSSIGSSSAGDTQPAEAPLILLAEDNEANIVAPSSYLQAKGYRIQVARNGQAAIDLAKSEVPNAILMDIQMPGMDGLTAIQHIRQLPGLTQTPIIALTAFAMEGDQERCLAAGANKYLSKPVKLKQLVSSIQELIKE